MLLRRHALVPKVNCASCCVCIRTHRTICHIGNAIQYVRSLLDGIVVGHHCCHSEDARELVHQQHESDDAVIALRIHHSLFVLNKKPGRRNAAGKHQNTSHAKHNSGLFCSPHRPEMQLPRYSTCTLATTRTFVSSSVARQRTANRAKRRDKSQVAHTVLSSTLPPRNSRRACAFPPRGCASCPEGFARRLLHSLDSFFLIKATNSFFVVILYFSNERVFFSLVLTWCSFLALFISLSMKEERQRILQLSVTKKMKK